MSAGQREPVAFTTPADNMPSRRRAVFSRSVCALGSQHALTEDETQAMESRHRRKTDDDSLRLIDDLTNRPIDPLFSDSVLIQRQPRSTFTLWFTRIAVFIICVAVGLGCSVMVKQLHTDPRKQVRSSLISELQQQNSSLDKVSGEVDSLHDQVSKQSGKLSSAGSDTTFTDDELMNGALPVKGQGITFTLADPLSTKSETNGALPRENRSSYIRVVTDTDLQVILSLLWRSGAEAIAINGHRIGVGTSVRTAGQTILVGVDQVTSPYHVQAIGDKHELAAAVSEKAQPSLYNAFSDAGIYPEVKQSSSLNLPAANVGGVAYAQRRK